MEQATNLFTKGLSMDTNPLTQGNDTLSDCLNGTIITMNGNEVMLQNDMGNGRVKNAKLPPGYEPVGIKEYGGVIYVAAYNPLTNLSQIGSFPSPQRTGGETDGENGSIDFDSFVEKERNEKEEVYKCNVIKTFTIDRITDRVLRAGDKFTVYSDDISETFYNEWIKKTNNVNNLFTLRLGILNSLNEFIDITDNVLPGDYGFFGHKDSEEFEQYSINSVNKDFIKYRQLKAINTYSLKLVSPLYIKTILNTFQKIEHEIDGEKNDKGYVLEVTLNYYHNSPTDFDYYYPEFSVKEENSEYEIIEKTKVVNDETIENIKIVNNEPEYDQNEDLYIHTVTYNVNIGEKSGEINLNVKFPLYHYYKGGEYINKNGKTIKIPSEYFYNDDKTEEFPPVFLPEFEFTETIDLNKLKSDYIGLRGWRYYNGDNFIKVDLDIEAYPKKESKLTNLTLHIGNHKDGKFHSLHEYQLIVNEKITFKKYSFNINAPEVLNAGNTFFGVKFLYGDDLENTLDYINTDSNILYINTKLLNGNYYGTEPLSIYNEELNYEEDNEENIYYGEDGEGNIYYDYEYMSNQYILDFSKIVKYIITPTVDYTIDTSGISMTTDEIGVPLYANKPDSSDNLKTGIKTTYQCNLKFKLGDLTIKNKDLYPPITINAAGNIGIDLLGNGYTLFGDNNIISVTPLSTPPILVDSTNNSILLKYNIQYEEFIEGKRLEEKTFIIEHIIESFADFIKASELYRIGAPYGNLSYLVNRGNFTVGSYNSILEAYKTYGDLADERLALYTKEFEIYRNGKTFKCEGISIDSNIKTISNILYLGHSEDVFIMDLDDSDGITVIEKTSETSETTYNKYYRYWIIIDDLGFVLPWFCARTQNLDINTLSTGINVNLAMEFCKSINRYYNYRRDWHESIKQYTYLLKPNNTTKTLQLLENSYVQFLFKMSQKISTPDDNDLPNYITLKTTLSENIEYKFNLNSNKRFEGILEDWKFESNTIECAYCKSNREVYNEFDRDKFEYIFRDINNDPLDFNFVYKEKDGQLEKYYSPLKSRKLNGGRYIIPNLYKDDKRYYEFSEGFGSESFFYQYLLNLLGDGEKYILINDFQPNIYD